MIDAIFDHAEDVARNIKTFWFEPKRPVRFIAGQFTEIHLPHAADDRGIRRWFTISSSPTAALVGITTKFASPAGSSFKQLLSDLKPGAPLKLAEPMGDFVLPKDPTIPLVFVAGGMGITPMHSMLQWLQSTGEQRTIHLIYAAANTDELAFLPFLQRANIKLTTIIKTPGAEYQGESGSLSTERILQLAPDDGKSLIYLAGPESMVETFFKEFPQKGIMQERLVTDYFPGYQQF